MEQPNQHLSSTPSPIDTQAAGPSNVTQPAGASIGGSQPTQGVETDISRADPAVLPPPPEVEGANPKKKRKPNASGPRTTASIWKHFTRLPENEVQDPTAACNYCGKRYLCDSKTHGTTNLNTHLKICTGGRVLDTYRSSLNPEVAEALICTQNWMRQSSNQPKELDVVDVFDQSEKVITGRSFF